MTGQPTTLGRRTFLKTSALAGGGLLINFSWLSSFAAPKEMRAMADELVTMNGYLKIASNGIVTIMSPNPEGGQNVKTSMPMIVAEELDIDWKKVIVEQAPLNTGLYTRQFIGGSQAIRMGWKNLRLAGATARQMLREAAATTWGVPIEEVSTELGMLHHKKSGRSANYGEMASPASKLSVPKEVKLKHKNEFRIIGKSAKNVDLPNIVTGKAPFGLDTKREGMLIAMIVHPPAFGMKLKSYDDAGARAMPGIKDIFTIKIFNDDYERQFFDTTSFNEVIAVVGKTTWDVMNARKALKIQWEPFSDYTIKKAAGGSGQVQTATIPGGLEDTTSHNVKMAEMMNKPANMVRKDGDPETAFKNAALIIERNYNGPFLAHNCMEPMNFFAHVTSDKVELAGPLQKPELTERALATRLGIPLEKIDIQITRLGGGFGRRSYAHFMIEAALISQKVNAPVKLIYTREDDMTSGIYRPTYSAKYRAAFDANKKLIAFHIKAGGIPETPLDADSFPAGAVENYLAESWTINSNITTGSFRAPRSNFIACAEQSFLDELAEVAGKDPIDFRLELLDRVINNPVGKDHDYDARRYAEVLKLLREKSGWGKVQPKVSRGVSIYYCHNSYAAQVVDVKMENGKLIIPRVCCVIDCGFVVNPDAATNLTEGAIVDGIGNALYGGLTFKGGVADKNNFNSYRMIRMSEAPKAIDVHFVQNDFDPTGMGEPAFPPVFAALANALYKLTGKRFYDQPFAANLKSV